jgi:hypothetical protein
MLHTLHRIYNEQCIDLCVIVSCANVSKVMYNASLNTTSCLICGVSLFVLANEMSSCALILTTNPHFYVKALLLLLKN